MPILERERLLLDRLRNHASLPVPYYEFTGSNTAFVGYRKIPGEALHRNMYATLSEEVRQGIADTLALFLTQMHQAISPNESFSLGYEECRIRVQWIESSLLGYTPFRRSRMHCERSLDLFQRTSPFGILCTQD